MRVLAHRRAASTIASALIATSLLPYPPALHGYSVLAHEALIDAVWDPAIVPLLLQRYPKSTPAELRAAHAYASGGSVIQDMGYYPFGGGFFSNLTHYVRTGDFVEALLRDSRNVNEYAFALGALSHYVADNVGHAESVNRSVPILYPHLERKYGKVVTFEDDPKAHVMTEFSFDAVQIAGAGYLPHTYHNYVGFRVPKPLVERAFKETYGLDMSHVFLSVDLSLAIYRRGSSEIIPRLTEIAWSKKRREIMRLYPDLMQRKFAYRLAHEHYEQEQARRRGSRLARKVVAAQRRIGITSHAIVLIFEVLPKVGPLRTLAFKPPTPGTQDLFIQSFGATVDRYRFLLNQASHDPDGLPARNLDTGGPVRAGSYRLADKTCAKLVHHLAKKKFRTVTPELRQSILAYYGDLSAPIETRQHPAQWRRLQSEVERLRASATSNP